MTDKKLTGPSASKAPLSLALELPLDDLAQAMAAGAAKYGRASWMAPGGEAIYLDAALRHIRAHTLGEVVDDESGAAHLAHAAASVLISLAKRRLGVHTADTAAGTHYEAAQRLLHSPTPEPQEGAQNAPAARESPAISALAALANAGYFARP
jgi:dTDP-4-dehydrorhamnose reductase